MRLISYWIKNFSAVREYRGSLLNNGLTSVTGYSHDDKNENGAGKSSITGKAIFWILFGRTPLGTKYDKVVHRKFKNEETYGEIIFNKTHLDNNQYKVIRSRQPNNLTLSILDKDEWVDLSDKDMSSTQAKINLLLGTSFETFIQTNFFGQGRLVGYPELAPSDRKKVLSDILPFELINQYILNTEEVLKKLKALNSNHTSNLSSLQGEIRGMSNAIALAEKEYNSFLARLERKFPIDFKFDNNYYTSLQANLKIVSDEITSLESQLTKLKITKELLNRKHLKTCPTCNRPMDADSQQHITDELNKVLAQIDQLSQIYEMNLETQLKLAEENKIHQSYLDFKEASETPNPFNVNSLSLEKEALLKEESNLKNTIDNITSQIQNVTLWYDIYKKDLPLYLYSVACPILNERIEFHLNQLGLSQFHVECSTIKELSSGEIKEEFDLKVWSDFGGEGFDSLSGGEQQMISFACTMALSDLLEYFGKSTSNILILDEPFTMLSPKNCEAIVNYLTGFLSGKKDTTFLISNDNHLQTLISNSIFVEKRNGVSYVAEKKS